jgi:hypothetical protein
MLGIGFDRTGSYDAILVVLPGALLVSFIPILFLPPYRYARRERPE